MLIRKMGLSISVAVCFAVAAATPMTDAQIKGTSDRSSDLLPISDGSGEWGYINRQGNKMVVPLKFSEAGAFVKDSTSKYAVVSVGNDHPKCGYIDRSGRIAIALQFTFCDYFSGGLATVQVDNHLGSDQMEVINEEGRVVISARFSYVGPFVDGLAPARIYGEKDCGYIDSSGSWSIRPRFDYCDRFSEEMAVIGFNPCGFINKRGEVVIEPQFARCERFRGNVGLVAEYYGWNWFLTNTAVGRFVLRHTPRDEGDMPTWSPRPLWGFISRNGTWQLMPHYLRLGVLSSGMATAGDDEKSGYVTANGEFLIRPAFAMAERFEDEYAAVFQGQSIGKCCIADERRGKWGIIDRSGTFVLSPRFPFSSMPINFGGGIFRIDHRATREGRTTVSTTYIDKNGEFVWPRLQKDAAKKQTQ